MKVDFSIEALELGDKIECFNGEIATVETIEKCLCGNCNTYYINGRYNTDYGYIKHIIKKDKNIL